MTIEKSAVSAAQRQSVSFAVRRALKSAGAMSLAFAVLAGTASAQEAETAAPEGSLAEITVTGTRIVRDGYEAPTPLTVMSIDELKADSPMNIADAVNQMPSVSGSTTPANSQTNVSNGQAGINSINLRGLGTVRTLVLLDGQRTVGAAVTGVVDVSNFPQQLIERVDVVTGGASSAYGSDAVSGVVNFVLDKEFTGVKSEILGGITGQGDDGQYKASAAFGTPFADSRGHFLLSGEYSKINGVLKNHRDWNEKGWKIINNPNYTTTNGQPERLLLPQVSPSSATLGGVITSGNLRGTAFGPGGVPFQYPFGPVNSTPFSQGSPDWQSQNVDYFLSLDPETDRSNLFSRLSFDVTDSIQVYGQALWAKTKLFTLAAPQFNLGNITIKRDNAFLPESLRSQLVGPTFLLGSFHGDLAPIAADNTRTTKSFVLGVNGSFGDGWSWDAYYQRGITDTNTVAPDTYNRARFTRAVDAVRNGAGQIVCGVNADGDTTNDDAACVPYNTMGIGVNSDAVRGYLLGDAWRHEIFQQDVAAASIQGEPFSSWAGPVSIATGVEWREESVEGKVDPTSQVNGWFVGNYLPNFGKYNVKEAFVETVIPLAADLAFADSLDLNGAARYTDYSISGEVTTWKVGLTYAPIRDVKLRATRSRDIRAPNLAELFQAGTANTNNVVDPFNNNVNVQYQGLAVGNTALVPEEADTLGLGIVYQPSWAPGLSASVDYFDIEINGSIGSVTAQQIVDQCFTGNQDFCSAITRGAGPGGANQITRIRIQPFNLVTQNARGIDFEAGYRLPSQVLGGDVAIRGLVTKYLENYSNNGINVPTDRVGENLGNGPPDWLARVTASWTNDALTVSLAGRGVSEGVYDNSFIECTTGCPRSTVDNRTINDNTIKGAVYLDGTVAYAFKDVSVFSDVEVFLSVKNVFDKDPPVVAPGPGGTAFSSSPVNATFYDYLGRTFRAGFRMNL